MLTITPCTDREILLDYCKKCHRSPSAAHYLYLAKNRDALLAACLFEVGGDHVQALLYESAEPDDPFVFDGVIRAGLNYAADQGIENGFIPEEFWLAHKQLFSQLRYP